MKSVSEKFKNDIVGKSGLSNKRPNIFLYFAGFVVNIMSIVTGIVYAWSSPVSPKLQSTEDNPLGVVLSIDQISWLASLLSLGCVIGCFAGAYLADKFGRKNTLAITTIPIITTFIILNYVHYLLVYYITRFIMGEIAEIHNRGSLGCFLSLLLAAGFLFAYAVGPYVTIFWFNWCCVIPSIIFSLIYVLFIPETPYYYIMTNRQEEAKKSLKKFRCNCEDIEKEFLEMTMVVKESLENKKGFSDIFKTKHLLKSLYLSVSLMVFQQLTGIGIVMYYMQLLFENANSSIPTAICAVIIGTVQMIFATLASAMVDKLGRRPLLLISNAATTIALIIICIYSYLQEIRDMSGLGWIPLVIFIFYSISSNIGMRSIPFALVGELFPPHIKSAAAAITVSSCFLASFIIVKIFPIIADWIGNWFAYLLLSIGNLIGTVYIWYFMPETKGKTLTEIMDLFK